MQNVALDDELAIGGRRWARWFVLPIRKLVFRLIRRLFVRHEERIVALEAAQARLEGQLEGQSQQIDSLVNLGWDQAHLLRRLASLEQQVEDLTSRLVTMQNMVIDRDVPEFYQPESLTRS